MKIRTTEATITTALKAVNAKFQNNIVISDLDNAPSNYIRVRLKTLSYDRPGYRVTGSFITPSKRMPYACWHVWGEFLDEIARLDPEAKYIDRTGHTRLVSSHNWEDWNVGSYASPLPMSDACDCQHDPVNHYYI